MYNGFNLPNRHLTNDIHSAFEDVDLDAVISTTTTIGGDHNSIDVFRGQADSLLHVSEVNGQLAKLRQAAWLRNTPHVSQSATANNYTVHIYM